MTISSTLSEKGELTIFVKGRFDFSALQVFRSAYENSGKATSYCVDMSESEFLDSSALGMLLALRDYAGGDDATKVRIIHCNPDVKKILTVTKLDELFQVE